MKSYWMAQGKMRMVGANTVEGEDESEILRLAAAVEGSTRHPLADAVLLAANNKHIQVRCCMLACWPAECTCHVAAASFIPHAAL